MTPLLAGRHVQVRDAVRRFADERIRPVANGLDESERFPAELYTEMAGLGLFGVAIPEALGGAGGDALAYAVVMEELARGYASVAAAPTPSPRRRPAPISRTCAAPRRAPPTAGRCRAGNSGSTTRRCATSRACSRVPIRRQAIAG